MFSVPQPTQHQHQHQQHQQQHQHWGFSHEPKFVGAEQDAANQSQAGKVVVTLASVLSAISFDDNNIEASDVLDEVLMVETLLAAADDESTKKGLELLCGLIVLFPAHPALQASLQSLTTNMLTLIQHAPSQPIINLACAVVALVTEQLGAITSDAPLHESSVFSILLSSLLNILALSHQFESSNTDRFFVVHDCVSLMVTNAAFQSNHVLSNILERSKTRVGGLCVSYLRVVCQMWPECIVQPRVHDILATFGDMILDCSGDVQINIRHCVAFLSQRFPEAIGNFLKDWHLRTQGTLMPKNSPVPDDTTGVHSLFVSRAPSPNSISSATSDDTLDHVIEHGLREFSLSEVPALPSSPQHSDSPSVEEETGVGMGTPSPRIQHTTDLLMHVLVSLYQHPVAGVSQYMRGAKEEVFDWVITDIHRKKRNAKPVFSPHVTSLLSHHTFRIKISPNGSSVANRGYLSCGIQIIPGPFDDQAKWPFTPRYTMNVLDASGNVVASHTINPRGEQPDVIRNAFSKPEAGDKEVCAWGCGKLMRWKQQPNVLEAGDSLRIQVVLRLQLGDGESGVDYDSNLYSDSQPADSWELIQKVPVETVQFTNSDGVEIFQWFASDLEDRLTKSSCVVSDIILSREFHYTFQIKAVLCRGFISIGILICSGVEDERAVWPVHLRIRLSLVTSFHHTLTDTTIELPSSALSPAHPALYPQQQQQQQQQQLTQQHNQQIPPQQVQFVSTPMIPVLSALSAPLFNVLAKQPVTVQAEFSNILSCASQQ